MYPKIKIYSLILLLLFSISSVAKKVSLEKARQLAKNLIIEKASPLLRNSSPSISISNISIISENNHDLIYLFHLSPMGFIMVSADDRCYPIIGYSFENRWIQDELPPAISPWMEAYKKSIRQAVKGNIPSHRERISPVIKSAWDFYLKKPFIRSLKTQNFIDPLLLSTWNQGRYYNEMCPEDTNGHGGHAYTGCVATAMAQVLYYFRYPESGEGFKSYESSKYGTIEADFENTTYHWSKMLNVVYNESNLALAELIFHCGVSLETTYSPNGSGAETIDVVDALIDHFRYSPNLEYLARDSVENWKGLLQNNLDNKIPVLYRGRKGWGGHAFVCDGYQGDDFLHFNWGWGGACNGYFYIDNLNPAGYDFNAGQAAIFNIFPQENYPLSYIVADTLTSHCGTFEDGSGPQNYSSNTLNSWLIAPEDVEITNIQLRFDRLDTEPDQDLIRIYDGRDQNAPLIGTFSGSSIPDVITSSANALWITFETNDKITDAGWFATWYGYKESFCGGETLLTGVYGSFSDHSGPYDYVNSCECTWLIAPQDEEHDSISSITLKFSNFQTESDHDILSIYDGYDDSFPLIGTFSGTQIPDEIYSTGDKVFVKFTSNHENTGAGWQINYVSQFPNYCRETTFLPPSSHSFSDGSCHKKYNNNTHCSWHIKADASAKITLFFTKFEVEENYDLLTIYDPITNPPTILAEYSGFTIPPPVTSISGEMLITFISDEALIYDGWEAEYSINGLGIGDHEQDQNFNIYPNPAHNMIRIDLSETDIKYPAHIEIISLTGNVIYDELLTSSFDNTIYLYNRELPKGMFFIKVYNDDLKGFKSVGLKQRTQKVSQLAVTITNKIYDN